MIIDQEKEKQTILRSYRRLLRKAKPFLKEGDARRIKEAFRFAEAAHMNMRRKSGEPYIYHPLAVAQIVVEEIGLGTTAIIAALLHDVVEDTGYELADIERRFGKKIAMIVEGLTKISTKATEGKSIQAVNFQRLLLTISEDVRVVLIKIADRLHNMRTLDSMPEDKRLKIKSETEYIYAPLAHKLGLYSIKSELEDLSLKHADKDAYQEIVRKIEETRRARDRFIKKFTAPIEASLTKQGLNFEIKTRIKSIYSIYNKMRKQNIPFEQVFDLFAIRIIIDAPTNDEKSACWKSYSVVTDYYTPNVNRLRDWISTPKANGYESLHTTVMSKSGQWVEVQIRSKRMDDIAEKGYAAHWKYKHARGGGQVKLEQGIELWLREVREMLETSKNVDDIEFINEFKASLLSEEVYAFTPKGEMKIFPKGATVLDFAFEIHTEVGAKCLAAKVEGKLVPFNYELRNGDQVEILTATVYKANESWLKHVKTTKAKNKIKEYLKREYKIVATEGKEIIKRKLKQLKLEYNTEIIGQITAFFQLKSESELLYRVGKGLIDHTEIKKFKKEKGQEETKPIKLNGHKVETAQPEAVDKKPDKQELVVGDMKDLNYTIASCCTPIPGDPIFGFVTSNKGIKIHRTTCPNAVGLMANYGYRIMKARWSNSEQSPSEFNVMISIEGVDRMGIVNDVTKIISGQMQVNIRSIKIDTRNEIFHGIIELAVHSKQEFEQLLKKLEKIRGVEKVTRLEEGAR